MLQRAHRLAIPFENLDIPLGRGISIDPAHVFDKLVTRRRGGYCFEQNQVFLRALLAMEFVARPLLARVWLMAESTPPLTHTFSLVNIDGQEWIADAGFGGSFSPPMPLEDGATVQMADGTAHRLVRREHDWMLERAGDPAATDGRTRDTRDWQPPAPDRRSSRQPDKCRPASPRESCVSRFQPLCPQPSSNDL